MDWIGNIVSGALSNSVSTDNISDLEQIVSFNQKNRKGVPRLGRVVLVRISREDDGSLTITPWFERINGTEACVTAITPMPFCATR